MKYFINEKEKKILISTYQQQLEEKLQNEHHIPQDEKDLSVCKYLKELFGDIELDIDIIKVFINCYSSFGGRYFVRSDDDTLKGLLSIKTKYPTLSSKAIDEIGFYYIKDLFDEYQLEDILEKYIKRYHESDQAIEKYLKLVDKVAEKHQKQFDEEAESIDYLEDEYDLRLVKHLKSQIKHKHIHKDILLECLPESELIKKDVDQLSEFSKNTRIYFGMCEPLSYRLITEMTKDKELSTYPEELKYVSSFGQEVPVPFTKSEFIESTKRKQKRM